MTMLDWDKLRVFHAVAQAGSFTKAGVTLDLSQSAVSRQISALEERLNVSLFHRHARGLILTEQGEILNRTAHDIFARLIAAESNLADMRKEAAGPLKITTSRSFGSNWLAPRIQEFRGQNPNIILSLLLDDQRLDLSMRAADVAIRLGQPHQHDLIQKHLTKFHFGIYASKSYLEEHGEPKSVEELKNHYLIGYPSGYIGPFHDDSWIMRKAGVFMMNSSKVIEINSLDAIIEVVKAGGGLASLPDYMAREITTLQRVLPDIRRDPLDAYFLYPEELRNSKRVGLFRDFVFDHVKQTEF